MNRSLIARMTGAARCASTRYDLASGAFLPVGGGKIDGFCFSTATVLNDGAVLLAGGYGNAGSPGVNHAWIYESMRDYWDNRWHPIDRVYVSTPTAFGVFAHQTVPEGEPPRSYLERVYNIQRWTVFPRGGHFAPVEEPAAVAEDLTTFFHRRS